MKRNHPAFNLCLKLVHVVQVIVQRDKIKRLFQNVSYSDDGFYADRDDCRKFHVCYGGTQSVRWCKEGMLWDETKIGCSLQSITPCIGSRKKWGRDEGIILKK